ncbi:MAG: alanyl-tRNA editing protein, partial [Thermoplasmata archaeon]
YSHVDFAPAAFSAEDLEAMETAFNEAVDAEVPVTIYEEDRKVLETQIAEDRAILELIPRSIRRLRVIQIGDRDLCPCGGTHVRNTSEIGHMRILRRRSKGKGVDRVTYELV